MKKFVFTSDEIDAHKSDQKDWRTFVCRREAEIIFSVFPNARFRLALELGAGDGGQSTTIARHCDHLICTDNDEKSPAWLGRTILERQTPNVTYEICDAQDLSRFGDEEFDLVFSSNMLEHIPDVDRCLKECRRVPRHDGVMLHTMPSRWWRLANSCLDLVKRDRPGVHGVSQSQFQEFYAFGARVWRKRIESIGLTIVDIVGLPFYVGHLNSFIPVIKCGNALGLSASCLYVVRKTA